MNQTERMRWDRTQNCYLEPVKGKIVKAARPNMIVVAVQIVGGVKALEEESGCVYEHIIQWMEQGYVNELNDAEILSRLSRVPLEFFLVGCDSNDV